MKRIYNSLLVLLLLSSITGCKKVLDVAPFAAFSDKSAFETPERCLLALNGVYDAAQTGIYPGGQRGYPFGAANVQQGDNRGEDVINIQAFYQITYQATYNPSTANNVGMWNSLYALINKANISIDGFRGASSAGIISNTLATQYEAECRLLRALAHHELLIHFARPFLDGNGDKLGVPYRDFAVNSSETVNQTRTTPRQRVDTVYNRILADLNFAEANLPTARNTIRATKAVAIVLKMRAYMHMGRWNDVITEGNKIVPASFNPLSATSVVSQVGGWSLTASPDGAFTNNSSVENVFSMRNDALDNPAINGALASMFGSQDLGARGLVAISPIIWNRTEWRADDTRRTSLYRFGVNANTTTSVFTTKYRDYTNRSDFNPLIRYAEPILMLAEAEARVNGVTQRALDLLNVVRNRALPTPATSQYVLADFANTAALVNAILIERRIEFLAEGKRWADIHRTVMESAYTTGGIPAKLVNGSAGASLYGIGVPVTAGQASIPYADYRFIWPVPADEVTQNPIVVQNPNY